MVLKPPANEEPLGSGSGNAGEDPQVVSRDGRIIAADSSPGLTGPSQRLMEDCSEREITKSRVQELLAQACVSESEFERLGGVGYIDQAIEYRSQALSLISDEHAEKPNQYNTLGVAFCRRYERLGELPDINKAIKHLSKAVSLTQDGHADIPSWLSNLGIAYAHRFQHLGNLVDIDKAIECQNEAVLLTPKSHSLRLSRLSNLGNSYQFRFQRLSELTDVEKGVKCMAEALLLTPDGHAHKPTCLSILGNLYNSRFQRLGEQADINEAIKCQDQAVLLTPDGHTLKPARLSELGNLYLSRFQRLGELSDMSKAADCHNQAVQLTPDGHPRKPGRLINLGNLYYSRSQRLGDPADAGRAIDCFSEALPLIPDGHFHRSACLNNLGNSHRFRFQRLGELVDVEKAIEYQGQAVLLTPDGHADKPTRLNNLGCSYQSRFQRLGSRADVDKAIEYQAQAVQLTPDGHPDKLNWLNNLGISYYYRFTRLGEIVDIDKAIDSQKEAVRLTHDSDASKLSRLANLGNSYQSRFQRLGELVDIDSAIACKTQAMIITPDDHALKPGRLSNLGNSYQSRFQRFGEVVDVDKAIKYQSQAVLQTSNSQAEKPVFLNNLGNSYQSRFQLLGELVDVERGIECQSQAVLMTPDGHSEKPNWLNNLGISYQLRFQRLGEPADIDKAIEYKSQAVLLTPDGLSDKPKLLNNLGNAYQCRFERLGNVADVGRAKSSFQHAAQLIVINPKTQIKCARNWAKSATLLGLSPQPAYERCMELIPHFIWLGTTINQRYDLLTEISDLATEAAAWAISAQSYELAIEWLEEGSSIVWNQILHLRTPFDDLFAIDRALAESLQDVSLQLERAGSRSVERVASTHSTLNLQSESQHHHHLATEWDRLLKEARRIPGFQDFMRPRKLHGLVGAVKEGPLVIINVHPQRCDALIIQPSVHNIAHVPLDKLSHANAMTARKQLASLIGRSDIRSRGMILRPATHQTDLQRILAMLWAEVAKPILDFLGLMQKRPYDELPRLTWCTTGALSFLPLHAAGYYDGSQLNVPDLVVSSYTPTLSALLTPVPAISAADFGLLAVGQEFNGDLGRLPSTVDELAAIKERAKSARCSQIDGDNATVDAVLNAMEEHSWVHLACHAIQNPANPAHSAFHLYDGSLTLETITKRSFRNKGLAFLSACETATGDEKLPDEAIHLAAGMLMAGYPSVIATMWSIYDADAPTVAGQVYTELLKDGRMDCRGAARALHKAVAALREKVGHDSLERWVPFIHIGV